MRPEDALSVSTRAATAATMAKTTSATANPVATAAAELLRAASSITEDGPRILTTRLARSHPRTAPAASGRNASATKRVPSRSQEIPIAFSIRTSVRRRRMPYTAAASTPTSATNTPVTESVPTGPPIELSAVLARPTRPSSGEETAGC